MNPFKSVVATRPGVSAFNLSHYKLLSCDMGELIPILCEEAIPGDIFNIGVEVVLRMRPLVAPILHEVNVYFHYFFVPYRLLWSSWEDFISGGELGTDDSTLPTWNVTTNTVGSLWDYLGFPIGIDAAGARPIAFPQYAYNEIYNQYYRDQNLVTALTITTNEAIQKRAWEKDMYTSALASQEKGTVPALDMTLSGNVAGTVVATAAITADPSVALDPKLDSMDEQFYAGSGGADNAKLLAAFQKLTTVTDISGGTVTGFDMDDLRLNIAIKRWMELNNLGGTRHVEWLRSQYGVKVQDHRLDRPEYIGGSKTPVVVSEVLQTSETLTGTEQGTMVGHGIAVGRNFCAKKRIPEFGLIMGIMSIMPRTMYHQGIDRMWSERKDTRYDFYNPLFAGLSEQPVYESEIYASAVEAQNNTVFGYQGRYNEYRYRPNKVAGDMHSTFDHWHLCRQFGGRPTLNQAFIECEPRKDIFASTNEDGLLVQVGNIIRAIRPMPVIPRPGRL